MKPPDVNKLTECYAAILHEISADLHSEGMRVNVMHGVFQTNRDVRREFLLRLEGDTGSRQGVHLK
jgi:hypothetical protein